MVRERVLKVTESTPAVGCGPQPVSEQVVITETAALSRPRLPQLYSKCEVKKVCKVPLNTN